MNWRYNLPKCAPSKESDNMDNNEREALANKLEKCRAEYRNEWSTAIPSLSWNDLDQIVSALRQPVAPGGEPIGLDWGQVVQCLLRCMDHTPKGEDSPGQAKRMANALLQKSNRLIVTPPLDKRAKVIEECAKVCSTHSKWAEQQIEDDPTSTKSQLFATISNTADDCAKMIRDLLKP